METNDYVPTDAQKGIGIFPGMDTPGDYDPDLAGWNPGLPQTPDDMSAIVFSALSVFMTGLPSGEGNKMAEVFRGVVLGTDAINSGVVARFPDGSIWKLNPVKVPSAMFIPMQVVGMTGDESQDVLRKAGFIFPVMETDQGKGT